jgi:hypothetical protein
MGVHQKMTGAERVAKRRAALRAKGYKLKQYWLPDLNDPRIKSELALEAKEIRRLDDESDDMAFLESIRAEVWADEPDYDWGPDGPPGASREKDVRPE